MFTDLSSLTLLNQINIFRGRLIVRLSWTSTHLEIIILKLKALHIILLITICTLLPSFAAGQISKMNEPNDNQELVSIHHGLGLSAGMVGGWGFSYRIIPDKGFGFHTGFLYYSAGDNFFFNIAFEPLYYVHSGNSTSLYIAGGLRLTATDDDTKLMGGIGLGVSYRRFDRIWTSLDLIMTKYEDVFLPLPQGSIHYIF